jgi:digeranylgeranylglycerophospholipid reductase
VDKNTIPEFEVVIIGGGPAGGHCARQLAKSGIKVLLVERFKSFAENNFSSAGMLMETIEEFGIPEHVIGSYWDRIVIESSKKGYEWKSDKNEGVVLDFGRLRQFLADESIQYGAQVWMGHRYISKKVSENGVLLNLKNLSTNDDVQVNAKLVIDATGPQRKVMYEDTDKLPELITASGIEYLIEVPEEVYNRCSKALIFFMGDKWAEDGYSWIFPMENNILKVGSGRVFFDNKKGVSSKFLTEKVIREYLGLSSYKLIDVHGGGVRQSPWMKDTFYNNRVVSVGDAISAANPLGYEGIRYAMKSADMLVPYVVDFVKSGKNRFHLYQKKWRKKYALKWWLCVMLSKKVYHTYNDEKIDLRLSQYHKNSNVYNLIDILFRFKFNKVGWRLLKALFTSQSRKLFQKKTKS